MPTILVTGASSGIGEALYTEFMKDNSFIVYGLSRRGPDLCYDLKNPLPKAPILSDVSLLINCAGIMPFEETKEIFDVNFWGTYNLIQNLLPVMCGGGCIINVASVSGIIPDAELPIYAASKAAVISLTKSLAKKYAPGVRINCISPGFYKTNLVPGEIPKELIDTIPLGYASNPHELFDVAKLIWETKYMTGTNIVVDGGVSL